MADHAQMLYLELACTSLRVTLLNVCVPTCAFQELPQQGLFVLTVLAAEQGSCTYIYAPECLQKLCMGAEVPIQIIGIET